MNIRYRLDAYDEYCMFNDGLPSDPRADESITRSHVRLGSLDNIIHFVSYAKMLSKDIGLRDLRALLTTFLRLNHMPNPTDNAISGSEVWMVCLRNRQRTSAERVI